MPLLMRRRGESLNRLHRRPGLVLGALFGLEFPQVFAAPRLTHVSHGVVFLNTTPLCAVPGRGCTYGSRPLTLRSSREAVCCWPALRW